MKPLLDRAEQLIDKAKAAKEAEPPGSTWRSRPGCNAAAAARVLLQADGVMTLSHTGRIGARRTELSRALEPLEVYYGLQERPSLHHWPRALAINEELKA